MSQLVMTEVTQGIATLTLNDPDKMNALSQPMAEQLFSALEQARWDNGVRVVVLQGAGGRFLCGRGYKINENRVDCYAQGTEPETPVQANMWNLNRLILTLRQMEKPVIAKMEGACAGGGMSLALACDFSIAAQDTKMTCAFAGVGLAPDMGSTMMMLRRVSPALATDLFMTARRFTGTQAADWGMITKAVPANELEQEVSAIAKQLAAGPTQAYGEIKGAVNRILYEGLYQCMANEASCADRLIRTTDHAEAVQAFLEKRKPNFLGK